MSSKFIAKLGTYAAQGDQSGTGVSRLLHSICVVGPDYDVEDLRAVTSRIDKSGEEFCSGVEKISVGGCEDRWWLQFY
ncbi:hypothetical protein V6N13_122120 [Hibiscus sabdariffa]